ncbi:MAG: ABC transporter ATP-binding protein [Bacteroidales bacterium]|nr:ABC transporter ATP-binding protein [Porphyromonas sp.]MDD7437596.1 ABC transporter ATP-binding protein [Bacteroidales bacterium]MDY3066368.1 ABC transporter ATP-binding protein [Porphyromonas sp.]
MILAEGLSLTFPSPSGGRVGVGTAPGGLSFGVGRGEIFGIIGPDGAGKSTLFRILCSLMLPDKGRAIVAGYDTNNDYKPLRKVIGYMPGTFSLYPDLSVEENLKFFATIFGTTIEENYHLIEDIYSQIEPFKNRKARSLSGGMKQKLALSCALIHSPEILFLDEPTTGIDPISRVDLWNMLRKLAKQGVTIVVSTPYMDEAKQCDRIAFMQDGQFLTVESPQELERDYPYPIFEVQGDDRLELLGRLSTFPKAINSFAFGEVFHITTQEGVTAEEIAAYIGSDSMRQINAGLEDAFLLLSMPKKP